MLRAPLRLVRPFRLCMLAIAGAMVVIPHTPLSARQNPASVRATWADMETWTRLHEESRENEVGLGLNLVGPEAVMSIAVSGRLSVRNPTTPPRDIQVIGARGDLANPNFMPTHVLKFFVDVKIADKRATIDLSPSLVVDDPGTAVKFQSGIAKMRPADFIKMANAQTIAANVFGHDLAFTPAQIKALQALAVRLHLLTAAQ